MNCSILGVGMYYGSLRNSSALHFTGENRMASVKRTEAVERAVFLLEKGIDLVNRRMIVGIPYMEHNTDSEVSFSLAANFLENSETDIFFLRAALCSEEVKSLANARSE